MSKRKREPQDCQVAGSLAEDWSAHLGDWEIDLPRWDVDLLPWDVDLSDWDIDLPAWSIELPRWDIELPRWDVDLSDWSPVALGDWEIAPSRKTGVKQAKNSEKTVISQQDSRG